jgi:hypothetical protein
MLQAIELTKKPGHKNIAFVSATNEARHQLKLDFLSLLRKERPDVGIGWPRGWIYRYDIHGSDNSATVFFDGPKTPGRCGWTINMVVFDEFKDLPEETVAAFLPQVPKGGIIIKE